MSKAKRCLLLIMLMMISLIIVPIAQVQAGSFVTADAAILLDARTGVILYQERAYERRPPASTTKIMTAIIALERGNLDARVKVSRHAATTPGSSIWLREGEELSLRELLHGALLESGNDACVAIAEHIAGSEANFVRLMNLYARRLGAFSTHFVNTNGLPAKEHYTTARDLGTIAAYALRNPRFAAIVSTREKQIPWADEAWSRSLKNTNKLLWLFEGADGVKTGTTKEAGQCLVASATREGQQLVTVVLHSDARFDDAAKLLQYGFDHFRLVFAAEAGELVDALRVEAGTVPEVRLIAGGQLGLVVSRTPAQDIRPVITLDAELRAPILAGQELGKMQLRAGDQVLQEISLIAAESVPARSFWSGWVKRLRALRLRRGA